MTLKLKRFLPNRTVSWIIILAVSVVLRLAAAVYAGDQVAVLPGTSDQISYHHLAVRVLSGYGFTFDQNWWPATLAGAPTAHWSYLYTIYLVAVYALFGVHPLVARLIQAVLVGLLQPWLIYKIGVYTLNPRVALWAAALTAIYAYFIYYAAMLMTEPFYIVAILAALYFAISLSSLVQEDQRDSGRVSRRPRLILTALALGFSLGVAVLLRQLFLLFVPFLLLWVAWSCLRQRLGATVWPLILSAGVLLAMILPVTYFNFTRFHRFVLLNTNAGFAFFWGNHPIYGDHFIPILPEDLGSYGALIPPELKGLNEAALDQELLRRGLAFVRQDPIRYIKLSLSRIPAYFMFWPSSDSGLLSNLARVLSFGLFLPFMLYGLLRTLILPPFPYGRWLQHPLALLYLFILVYTAIHLLTWALIRYRLPVDAVLILFAAVAAADLFAWIRNRLAHHPALIPPFRSPPPQSVDSP